MLIADFCLLHLLDQLSLILKLVLGRVRKFSVGRIQIGYTDLLPLQVCGRSWRGFQLCGCTFIHQFIDWIQVKHPKFFLLIVTYIILSNKRRRRFAIYRFINMIKDSSFQESLSLFWLGIDICSEKFIKLWWLRLEVSLQLGIHEPV